MPACAVPVTSRVVPEGSVEMIEWFVPGPVRKLSDVVVRAISPPLQPASGVGVWVGPVGVAVGVRLGPIGEGVRVGVAVAIRSTFCAARKPILP